MNYTQSERVPPLAMLEELFEVFGFLLAQMVKCLTAMWETRSSIPALGRSPREGNGIPLQYSCLENPMDRGPWQATVLGVTKSQTRLK